MNFRSAQTATERERKNERENINSARADCKTIATSSVLSAGELYTFDSVEKFLRNLRHNNN